MEYVDANYHLTRHFDSVGRLGELIRLSGTMERGMWLRLLGEHWSALDDVWRHRARLVQLLGRRGPLVAMMTAAELEAYTELPAAITVFRGCSRINMDGICWSTDRNIAARFPTFPRYHAREPLLVTAVVSKHAVLAVKLDRDEAEIITFSARTSRPKRIIEPLPLPIRTRLEGMLEESAEMR